MYIEEKIFPRNIKGTVKSLDIYIFGIVKYYVRIESGRMIAIRAQAYYVPGLPTDLRIIYPQDIHTSEGYKGTFMVHFHNEHDSYTELNLKEEKPGWQNAEHVERFYIKYDPENNLTTHEAIIPNHIEKEVNELARSVFVTKQDNQNPTPTKKELL